MKYSFDVIFDGCFLAKERLEQQDMDGPYSDPISPELRQRWREEDDARHSRMLSKMLGH